MAGRDNDPNFPTGGLNITPSYEKYRSRGHNQKEGGGGGGGDERQSEGWQQDRQEDIEQYGIAGRVWEAAYILTRYLSCPSDTITFDPPCSLFLGGEEDGGNSNDSVIVELGAGAGVAGIHLALELKKKKKKKKKAVDQGKSRCRGQDTVFLTDLDNVLSLLERNVERANLTDQQNGDAVSVHVHVHALPWGSATHARDVLKACPSNAITHVLCSDLVYFPELLAPLLRSLIHLTTIPATQEPIEVLIGYKLRSYEKEEPFWRAFGVWFDFAPVLCKGRRVNEEYRRFGSRAADVKANETTDETPAEDEMFVFVAHRKRSTLSCEMPDDDEHLLGGWLKSEGGEFRRGAGAETFELLLVNAMQD